MCGVLSTVYYLDILCNLTMEDGRSFTNGGITAISSFSSCVCKNKFISIQEVDRTLLIAFFFFSAAHEVNTVSAYSLFQPVSGKRLMPADNVFGLHTWTDFILGQLKFELIKTQEIWWLPNN